MLFSSSNARASLARRRRGRGAVFVEAIIVASMLMLMLASGIFFHRLYLTNTRVLRDARLAAWSQAMEGCNGAVDLGGVWSDAGAAETPVNLETESAPSFFGVVSHTSARSRATEQAPNQIGGKSFELSAENTVACNEIAQSKRGDLISVFGYVSDNLLPSFF